MNVQDIYSGSDGEATKALYAQLATHGPIGEVATNLFRAMKSSERAKVYRGGGYRGMAYERKNWALSNLTAMLVQHASALRLVYGWQRDEDTPGYPWVVYVDLPTGQVSFHAPSRGDGPDYAGAWDGIKGVSADRIVRWCQSIVSGETTLPSAEFSTTEQKPKGIAPRWLWCRACACFWANRRTCPVHVSTKLEEKAMPEPLPELRPGVRAEFHEEREGSAAS